MPDIEEYRFGHIVIDCRRAQRRRDRCHRRWRQDGHALVVDDLSKILDQLPERLVVGADAYGRNASRARRAAGSARPRDQGRGPQNTDEAVRRCRTADAAPTAAALHLTCCGAGVAGGNPEEGTIDPISACEDDRWRTALDTPVASVNDARAKRPCLD
jgi:hypothetical protein